MTVPNCATLCDVETGFGQELRRRRVLSRLSQEKLARLSGVSASQIGNIEVRGASAGRTTVIDLAIALGEWKLDAALQLAGHGPTTEDEIVILNRIRGARARLDRVWDDLTARQQWAVVEMVESIVDPKRHGVTSGTVVLDEATRDPEVDDLGAYHHKQQIEPEELLDNESEDDLPQS